MINKIIDWITAPVAFLLTYLLCNLTGAALYVIHFQITNEGGRAPSAPDGWVVTTALCAAITMLNLCGLNQLLFLPIWLLPKLRKMVGFTFAVASGLIFGYLPLTIKNYLRCTFGHRLFNETPLDFITSWSICALLFIGLAWLCSYIFSKNRKNEIEQAGAGYPPQGVGSPDP